MTSRMSIPVHRGANLRELAFYGVRQGGNTVTQNTSSADQLPQIRAAVEDWGMRYIRFYAANAALSTLECISHVTHTLDLLPNGVQAIIVLTDMINSGFTIKADAIYYSFQSGELSYLSADYWIGKHYRENYQPFVADFMDALGSHPKIGLVELINEPALRGVNRGEEITAWTHFLDFVNDIGALIRQKSVIPISLGLSNSRQLSYVLGANFDQYANELYSNPFLDAASVHFYADEEDERAYAEIDAKAATQQQKLFYIGELGAPNTYPNRPQFYRNEIEKWFKLNAFTVMLWGFDKLLWGVGTPDNRSISQYAKGYSDFDTIQGTVTSYTPLASESTFTRSINTASTAVRDSNSSGTGGGVLTMDNQNNLIFEVVNGPLRVRNAPIIEPRALIAGISLSTGQQIKVDANSRTEAGGCVWWHHQAGWSAERRLDGTEHYMVQVAGKSLSVGFTFDRLPVNLSDISWVQYYGNAKFAFQHGTAHNYDQYSQGLHGGIDFGSAQGGFPVFAGVTGVVDSQQHMFGPRRIDIVVGNFRIIYGHLSATDAIMVANGQSVTPGTQLGVASAEEQHTHLEIRHGGIIVNPLLHFSSIDQQAIFNKFDPANVFQPYGQWQSPLDQPDILIGGKVIGPTAH